MFDSILMGHTTRRFIEPANEGAVAGAAAVALRGTWQDMVTKKIIPPKLSDRRTRSSVLTGFDTEFLHA
jgi:hypothetical protein